MDGWRHKDFQRPVSESDLDVLSMLAYPALFELESRPNELA